MILTVNRFSKMTRYSQEHNLLLRAKGTCLQFTLLFICTCFPTSHSVRIPDMPVLTS